MLVVLVISAHVVFTHLQSHLLKINSGQCFYTPQCVGSVPFAGAEVIN